MSRDEWEKDIEESVKLLAGATNWMGRSDEEIALEWVHHFRREHRTLQASAIRVLLQALVFYGDSGDAYYDLRNEAAVEACKLVRQAADQPIPFI